jgi:hypothetical protein
MSLKLAGHLFTGPYSIDTAEVRSNQSPVVYAVVAKGGPSWSPVFRVLDVGASPESGIRFANHPRRGSWCAGEGESLSVYMLAMPRSEFSAGDRESIVVQLREKMDPAGT